MTAEIAVLNKSAVALAADSAVTIGAGSDAKIYNSVNKIFELATETPIGVMIYNRLDYMGLPFETVIKEFRRLHGSERYDTVRACRNRFVEFLNSSVSYGEQQTADNIFFVLSTQLTAFRAETRQEMIRLAIQKGRVLPSKRNGFLSSILTREINRLQALPFANGYAGNRLSRFTSQIVDSLIDEFFAGDNINQSCRRKLQTYCREAIKRSALSSARTGLVFAGFGNSELCPTVDAIEIDGILEGQLKLVDHTHVDVTRGNVEAAILGFAQDDMVQSFVNGVDPDFRDFVDTLIDENTEFIFEETASVLGLDKATIAAAKEALSSTFHKLRLKFREDADQYVTRSYSQPIEDMVRHMPKRELATLAESLIEITSLKRKVTRERETVGGEVDVAIVSKSEGFVWTRRKHYFPADLNPRFFAKYTRKVESVSNA